ncbi:MAG: NAD-dependent epimerase/dehydratase family protein [Planctomycetota bacterium]|nr:MAG: NAD-dependent epimerase/dehydratase family protein [Planctomycetota bacterium]
MLWVTGASGFVGTQLLRRLRRDGVAALALARDPRRLPAHWAAVAWDLEGRAPDVASLPRPSGLLHLAALAHVPECERDPQRARAVNVAGPARLYEAVLERWPQTPVLHVSSAYVYRPQPAPVREEDAVEPASVYGVTKLEGEALALGLRDRGHRVSVLRPFNHSGAGQDARYVLPSFALRLAALERRGGGTLEVGNLHSVRDFLHVSQVAQAYLDLLPRAGEFEILNVCSGTGQRVGDLLDGLQARLHVPVSVRVDGSRLRGAADAERLVGDPSRLQAALGRSLRLDREALLDELIEDARRRVAAGESVAGA